MEVIAFVAAALSVACLGLALAFRQLGVERPADMLLGARGYFRPPGLHLWRASIVLGAVALALLTVSFLLVLPLAALPFGLLVVAVVFYLLAWLDCRRPGQRITPWSMLMSPGCDMRGAGLPLIILALLMAVTAGCLLIAQSVRWS